MNGYRAPQQHRTTATIDINNPLGAAYAAAAATHATPPDLPGFQKSEGQTTNGVPHPFLNQFARTTE